MLDAGQGGSTFFADKIYDTDAIHTKITARGGFANIPAKRNRRRRFAFSAFRYRYRNLIERFFEKTQTRQGLGRTL